MSEVTEQRPMNNEYANLWKSKLSPVTSNDFLSDLMTNCEEMDELTV